jgi:hypothetical protein
MESQADRDRIAEEAVGQRHESAPPYAGTKPDMSPEEAARRFAAASGAAASTPEKTAESIGERVGDAYSDAESVARQSPRKVGEHIAARGESHKDVGSNRFLAPISPVVIDYFADRPRPDRLDDRRNPLGRPIDRSAGDSTVATDVERVLGGVAPHLMVTDPPYGVDYDPAWRNPLHHELPGVRLLLPLSPRRAWRGRSHGACRRDASPRPARAFTGH